MKSRTFVHVLAASLAAAAFAQAAAPACAQGGGEVPAQATPAQPSVMHVDLATASEGARSISIPRGKSAIIDLPVDARDVLVTNPQVADAVLRTPRRIYIVGVAPGMTDAAFFDSAGRPILALNIRVDQDFSAVSQTINRLIPGAQVHVESANTSIVLSGEVASLSDADKAVQIAQQFTGTPAQVVDLLSIAGKEQVMLKVRIVEMQRSVIKQLGFNLSAVMGQLGSPQFMIASAAQYAINGSYLGAFSGGSTLNTTQQPQIKAWDPNTKSYDLPVVCQTCTNGGPKTISTIQTTAGSTSLNSGSGMIQAFEQIGLVRTLAEPNLTAVSGKSASFLAGGEFPVPSGINTTGQVSIQFEPYGVGLGFTPVVLSGGRISLKISTEVSQLTNQGSFTIQNSAASSTGGATSPALTIPGLIVRRAETTVELPSGGAMMIAGLLQENTAEDISSVPGLINLPVLGALFRSRDYQEGETELVVIVTPYLVKPTSPASLQTPADGLKIADDAQTDLMGEINKAYKLKPDTTRHQTYQGPVGYVIDQGAVPVRSLIVILAATLACGCATGGKPRKPDTTTARLPTEQWSITVNPSEDEILLAPHPDGLSKAQQSALVDLVARWRDGGGGPVIIKEPAGGQGQSYRSTAAIQGALELLGVDPDQVNITGYDAGPRPGAPIVVGYTRYKAKGPECGRDWKSYTKSFENKPNNNFGCANTANIAAMIANPADLIAPRASDPSDAGRRETVLTKYRQGAITSAAKDAQASGSVSQGISQ